MTPSFSVIIPVYDEAKIVNNAINHLIDISRGLKIEIIVVDGHPETTTLGVIGSGGIIKIKSARGRSIQMNAGAISSTGEILVFLHCDTLLPPEAFIEIHKTVHEKKINAGAFDLGINSPKIIYRIIENLSSFRSRITRIPYGDQVFFTSRDYFFDLGGFKEIPLMEDVEFMEKIKKRHDEIRIIKRKVMTSSRRWENKGIFQTTVLNWRLICMYYLGVKPERLADHYNSRVENEAHLS